MPEYYKNSPLVEVVADFHFSNSSEWDLLLPGGMFERLKPEFPKRQQVNVFGGIQISGGSSGPIQQIIPQTRLQFVRENGSAMIQIGPEILAVNHLQPYVDWSKSFKPLLKTGWHAYKDAGGNQELRNISLRYINRIQIPKTDDQRCEFEHYLEFRPYCGPNLNQDHGPFRVLVTYPYREGKDLLTLELHLESFTESTGVFRLDITYKLVSDIPPQEDLIDWYESAHGYIHGVFESCLTEKLRDLFRGK